MMTTPTTCRTCLSEGARSPIFGGEARPTPAEMIAGLTELRPSAGDGLPVQICAKCMDIVQNAFSFKLHAERADAKLRLMAPIAQTDDLSAIKLEEIKVERDEPGLHLDNLDHLDGYDIDDHPQPDDQCSDSDSEDCKPLNELKVSTNTEITYPTRRTFICKLCDKTYKFQKSLTNHLQKHLSFEPFVTINQKSRESFFETHKELAGVDAENLSDDYIIKLMMDDIKNGKYHKYMGEIKLDPDQAAKAAIKRLEDPTGITSAVKQKKTLMLKSKIKKGFPKRIRHQDRFHECSLCLRPFRKADHLIRHMSVHRYNYPDKCGVCFKVFPNKEMFMRHDQVKCQSIPKPFGCATCKMKFAEMSQFKTHFSSRHKFNSAVANSLEDVVAEKLDRLATEMDALEEEGEVKNEEDPPLALLECQTELETPGFELDFSELGKVQQYEAKKYPRRGHQCSQCSRFFSRTNSLIRHMAIHNYQYPDKCTVCDKVFPNEEMLRRHSALKHSPDVPKPVPPPFRYKCEKCGIELDSEDLFNQHVLEDHDGESVPVSIINTGVPKKLKLHKCQDCNKAFKRKDHLDKHRKYRACLNVRNYQCKLCLRRFKKETELTLHISVHQLKRAEDSLYHCTLCDATYATSTLLNVHLRRHRGERPFKCDVCSKAFARRTDLTRHNLSHTGIKSSLCSICGKGFSRPNMLRRHMLIHLGLRPYKCNMCPQAFTQSNDLQLHIRRHTGERPYVCEVCGLRFINGTALTVHRRSQGHNASTVDLDDLSHQTMKELPLLKKGRKSLKPKKLRKKFPTDGTSSEQESCSEEWSAQES